MKSNGPIEETPPDLSRPEIGDFTDYRDFLLRLYEFKKARNHAFSFQMCSKKLGVVPSYLKLVTSRRRHISLDKLPDVATVFQLSQSEKRSLLFLFLANTSKSEPLRAYFMGLFADWSKRVGVADLDEYVGSMKKRNHGLFQTWLSHAIWSMVRFPDFRPDARWICERLGGDPISVEEVGAVFETLLAQGTLRKNETGRIEQVGDGRGVVDVASRNMADVLLPAMAKIGDAFRDPHRHVPNGYQILCLPIHERDLEWVRGELHALVSRLEEKARSEPMPTDLVYMTMAYVTLTPKLSSD